MNKIKDVNEIFLVTVLVAIFAPYGLSIFPSLKESFFVSLLLSEFILILPMLVYLIYKKQKVKDFIRFRKIKIVNIILLVIFSYLITPFMSLLNAISLLFSTNVINDTVTEIVNTNPLFISIFVIAFVPCVLEESVYRGVFFNEYRKIDPLKGILLSGLLFGLMHRNFNQFIYAFAMGTIFALLIEATDSILSSMIVHFVINGTSVLMTYLLPRLENFAKSLAGNEMVSDMTAAKVEYTAETLVPIIIVLGGLSIFTTVLAALIFVTIAKIEGKYEHVKRIFNREKKDVMENTATVKHLISVPLIIGIILCVAFMIWVEIDVRIL